MNERIKELAEQAGLSHMPSNYPDMADLYKGADFELEKFAELIVQECVDRIKNADMTDLEGSDPDDVLWLVERQIVKHFGVE